jgi:hypothetical protein
MSLREALEAKQRRRAVVPVQITDTSDVLQEMQAVLVALSTAKDEGVIRQLRLQLEETQQRHRGHFADVKLQSLPPAEWEDAVTLYGLDDGRVPVAALAVLVSASCVDDELRDPDWWTEQLAKPAWSDGDLKSLQAALLHLNVSAPDPLVPKD